jgi:hypothetical protein
MTREAEAERECGTTAIGADDDGCRNCHVASVDADEDAGRATLTPALVDDRAPHGDAGVELTPRRDRVLQQDPIEIAPQNRAARHARGIRTLDRDAALAGQEHPVDTQPATLDLVGDAERAQTTERPGVDRVAAQLVARERRPIDDENARAGARQHQPGDRARRPRADDQDVRLAQ